MKIKLELGYDELNDLNDEAMAQSVIDMAHAMLDEALNRRAEATKCTVTIDSDKE